MTNCYGGSGKFYNNAKFCAKDCDITSKDPSCGGMVDSAHIRLYDSASACCLAEFGWMENELCVARSNAITVDKYWPDKTKSKCFMDSKMPAQDLTVQLYNTAEACCRGSIGWIDIDHCTAVSSGTGAQAQGSSKFYVDWSAQKCVKDCVLGSDTTCGGVAENWEILYDSTSECCDQLQWVERKKCLPS